MANPPAAAYAPGQPVTVPPDFPVTWDDPAQARQLWMLDRIHFGTIILPLVAEIWQGPIAAAFNQVAEQYHLPIRVYFRRVNGYLYSNYRLVGLPPEFLQRGLSTLEQVFPRLGRRLKKMGMAPTIRRYMNQLEPAVIQLELNWRTSWQPEIQDHLRWWQRFDLAAASLPDLLTHLQTSLQRLQRIWHIHFQLIIPMFLAVYQFNQWVRTYTNSDDPLVGFRYLQGFNNSFLQGEQALAQLARQARTLPAIRQILLQEEAGQVMPCLATCAEGQIYLAELRAFLNQYGRRGHKVDGLGEPGWREDPTPVIHLLRELLLRPDRDLTAELQTQTSERELLVGQLRDCLQNESEAVRGRAETLLHSAQTAAYLHEEHHFWIDQQVMYELRQVLLALGQRLSESCLLSVPQDVFWLPLAWLQPEAWPQETQQLKAQVQAHQQEADRNQAVTPPPALGTMPWLLPGDDPLSRVMGQALGSLVPRKEGEVTAQRWRGTAAASGIVTGRVRVIHSLAEADNWQPDEVLVVESLQPPWMSLLANAAALVTDEGGVLSHCAFVARQYGRPAVVGTGNASRILQTGQRIEVDGTRGVVRLL